MSEDLKPLVAAFDRRGAELKTIADVLLETAKLWPGHDGVNWETASLLDLALLIRDAVQGDRAKIADHTRELPALTVALERSDGKITSLVERHLVCRVCALRIVTAQRDELKRTVLGEVFRKRTEAAEQS